jgi:hypothetical protein
MRTKEGRPSREEESAQHSVKSTFHASTPREIAHRLAASDTVTMTAFTLAVALILTGLCGLVWMVA